MRYRTPSTHIKTHAHCNHRSIKQKKYSISHTRVIKQTALNSHTRLRRRMFASSHTHTHSGASTLSKSSPSQYDVRLSLSLGSALRRRVSTPRRKSFRRCRRAEVRVDSLCVICAAVAGPSLESLSSQVFRRCGCLAVALLPKANGRWFTRDV